MTAARASYADAGAAMRATHAAIVSATSAGDLTETRARVLLIVTAQVGSYSRLSDTFSHKQLADLTGVSEKTVGRTLAAAHDLGILKYVPGQGAGKSHGRLSRITLHAALVGDSAQSPTNGLEVDSDSALSWTPCESRYREDFPREEPTPLPPSPPAPELPLTTATGGEELEEKKNPAPTPATDVVAAFVALLPAFAPSSPSHRRGLEQHLTRYTAAGWPVAELAAHVRTGGALPSHVTSPAGLLATRLAGLNPDSYVDRQKVTAAIAAARTGPPCAHGTQGGESLHPVDDTPFCPLCRKNAAAGRPLSYDPEEVRA